MPFYQVVVVFAHFPMVTTGLLLCLVTIPFLLMRLWTVTPQHIDPPTRISVLDFIQASALRRSAERATEKSRLEEASHPGGPPLPIILLTGCPPLQFLGKSQGSHEEMREAVPIVAPSTQPNQSNGFGLGYHGLGAKRIPPRSRSVCVCAGSAFQPTDPDFFPFHAFDFERCSELLKTTGGRLKYLFIIWPILRRGVRLKRSFRIIRPCVVTILTPSGRSTSAQLYCER